MTKRENTRVKRFRRYLESWVSVALAVVILATFSSFIWLDQINQKKKLKVDLLMDSIDRNDDLEIEIDEFLSRARHDYAEHWLSTIVINSYWREGHPPSNIDAIYASAESGEWPTDLSVRLGFIFAEMDDNGDAYVDRNELKKWVRVNGG